MQFILGVDLGEELIHVAVLDGLGTLVGGATRAVGPRSEDSLVQAVDEALRAAGAHPDQLIYGAVVSNQCTLALRSRMGLARVAVVRLSEPAGSAIPPLFGWPEDLLQALGALTFELPGGSELDGREISPPPDDDRLGEVVRQLADAGTEAVVVAGVFSPLHHQMEAQVAARLRELAGRQLTVLPSHWLGSVGLRERENSMALNAALTKAGPAAGEMLSRALQHRGVTIPIYVGQNDGTVMSLARARRFPLLTVRSADAHRFRGAAHLGNQADTLVILGEERTVGVGLIEGGLPRDSILPGEIEGIRVNVPVPDYVTVTTAEGVGPLSAEEQSKVERAVSRVKGHGEPVPAICAGTAADRIPDRLAGLLRTIRLDRPAWVGAVGAALAPVGGRSDAVYSLQTWSLEGAKADAISRALNWAVDAGGDPETVRVARVAENPFTYMPGDLLRIRAKVTGSPMVPALRHHYAQGGQTR